MALRAIFDSNWRVNGRSLKIRLKRPAGNTGYFGTDPAHERSHSPDPVVLADIQFKNGIYPHAGGADELSLMERVDRETGELKHDFSELGLVNSNVNDSKRQVFRPLSGRGRDCRLRLWQDAGKERFSSFTELNVWLLERCRGVWQADLTVAEMLEHEQVSLMPMVTHHCHIVKPGNKSFRLRHSTATAKSRIKAREPSKRGSPPEKDAF